MSPWARNALLVLLKPFASLLGIIFGWTFLESQVSEIFSSDKPSEADSKRIILSILGLITGIFIASVLLRAGSGGVRRR